MGPMMEKLKCGTFWLLWTPVLLQGLSAYGPLWSILEESSDSSLMNSRLSVVHTMTPSSSGTFSMTQLLKLSPPAPLHERTPTSPDKSPHADLVLAQDSLKLWYLTYLQRPGQTTVATVKLLPGFPGPSRSRALRLLLGHSWSAADRDSLLGVASCFSAAIRRCLLSRVNDGNFHTSPFPHLFPTHLFLLHWVPDKDDINIFSVWPESLLLCH